MMKPIGLIIIAGVLALGGGILVRGLTLPAEQVSAQPLPDFEFPDVSDQQHSISEWQGKIRVINFWATWCPPCIKEMPAFVEMQDQFGSKGLQFIGIALEDKEPVKEYLAKMKINYPILIGDFAGVSLAHQLGNTVDAVPFTLIFNQKGEIIYQHQGGISKEDILEVIQPLMN